MRGEKTNPEFTVRPAPAQMPDRDDDPTEAGLRREMRLADETATETCGARLARALAPGDAVMLSGGLGAGKSALARAVVRALLGAPDAEVPSPSYTLVNVYETPRGEVWHADLYRLADMSETAELGLDDAFDTAIVLLEWPERLGAALPARRLEIALEIAGETARRARVTAHGRGWEAAMASLGEDP